MPEETSSPVREVRQAEGATIIDLTGDIDMHRAPALSEALTPVVQTRPKRLVLNFADVNYIDSTGLGTLVYVLRQVNAYKGKMVLLALKPTVRSVFEVTKLMSVFALKETEADAITA